MNHATHSQLTNRSYTVKTSKQNKYSRVQLFYHNSLHKHPFIYRTSTKKVPSVTINQAKSPEFKHPYIPMRKKLLLC